MSKDNFSILQQISESPTATVYKAYQKALERAVLLKVLHKHLARDKSLVARFVREARSCAVLHSENIVQVYDLTEVSGAPAIVMEYVEGQSLEEYLVERHPYSEDLLLKVAVSVLHGLSYAHERGIIHRDIKPGNILLSDNGTVKITDFGLASVADAPVLTMEGGLIGTPAYMSPEQARGEVVDARSDLFSLGITLIEILSGEKILLGDSYAECINRIQNFRLASIEKFRDRCTPQMYEFFGKLLAPDRNSRFASASDALRFLSSFLGEERVGIKRRSAMRLRNKILVAAGAVILVGAAVLLFTFTGNRKINPFAADTSGISPPAVENPARTHTPGTKDVSVNRSTKNPQVSRVERADTAGLKRIDPNSVAMKVDASMSTDSGFISVGRCSPWAKIYIDSSYVGQTPIGGSMKVPVGRHTVTFSNPNFTPIAKYVMVKSKTLSTVECDFMEDAGWIFVTAEPWAKVFVDDNLRETTPSVDPIPVSPGTRIIRLENPSYSDITRSITVKPRDTLRLSFTFHSKE